MCEDDEVMILERCLVCGIFGCSKSECAIQCNKTLEFISKARDKHGYGTFDTLRRKSYDYRNVRYETSKIKVTIVCREHGEFSQTPASHLSGSGCVPCNRNPRRSIYATNIELWKEKAREAHGDKYDYSNTIYKSCNIKVAIGCPEHGEFLQKPGVHLRGAGCPKCGALHKRKPLTFTEFVRRSTEIHKNKYDYSKARYKNSTTYVTITCDIHGDFQQLPMNHVKGRGCGKCGRKKAAKHVTINTDEWIESARKVHGDRYDYSKVKYENNHSYVTIICKKHGEFSQKAHNHTSQRQGCPECGGECGGNRPMPQEVWIDRAKTIHGDKYNYSSVEYVNANTKVTIICKEHGKFEQIAMSHLLGYGCSRCSCSKGEAAIDRWLIEYVGKNNFVAEYRIGKSPYRYDFYVPSANLLIEYDGKQHFKSVGLFHGKGRTFLDQKDRDIVKTKMAIDNGYHLVRIPYNAYDEIHETIVDVINEPRSLIMVTTDPEVEDIYFEHRNIIESGRRECVE